MGLFSRRPSGPLDSAFTFMTRPDADHLRMLVVTELGDMGVTATVSGGEARGTDGTVLGLWNLATICGATEIETWPEVVRDYLRDVLAVDPTPLVTPPPRQAPLGEES